MYRGSVGRSGTKRGDTERSGVVDPCLVEGTMGRCDRRCRGGRGRLPDFHVDDMPAGCFDLRRRRHHVHHHERWNFAPGRGGQELLRAVSKCRIEHRDVLSARRAPEWASGTGYRPRVAAFGGLLSDLSTFKQLA